MNWWFIIANFISLSVGMIIVALLWAFCAASKRDIPPTPQIHDCAARDARAFDPHN